jgi:hypothetical protein
MKGVLIGLDVNPVAGIIVCEYNPETMTRWLEARVIGANRGDAAEVHRLTGLANESIII